MLEWLEAQGHWGFISASYAIAALALLADIIGQRIKRNELKRRVLERQARRRLQRNH